MAFKRVGHGKPASAADILKQYRPELAAPGAAQPTPIAQAAAALDMPAPPPPDPPKPVVIVKSKALEFTGIYQQIMDDETPEIAIMGGRDSAKSWTWLTKEIRALQKYPGIRSFLFRMTEKDTETKLRPLFRELCDYEGVFPEWDKEESGFLFPNGSKALMFGLKAMSSAQRYSKLRGLGVSRVGNDQSEELERDIASELRFSLRQPGFPHQLIFVGQPPDFHHWLPKDFPVGVETKFKNRRLYQLTLFDNPHLPRAQLQEILQAYPEDHPNYRTLVLGQYGTTVTGEAIYRKLFSRSNHLRPLQFDPRRPIFECFDFGQLNPCWIVAQQPAGGGLHLLGGLIGLEMFLADFLPVMWNYRQSWFPSARIESCCTLSCPYNTDGHRFIEPLAAMGIHPVWQEGSNSPQNVLAMIERQATYLRQRGMDGKERFSINDDQSKWLRVAEDGVEPSQFMAYAYEGAYAWSDKTISVGRNELKQPHADGWFEFSMRCVEQIELNFGIASTDATTQTEPDEVPKYRPVSVWS